MNTEIYGVSTGKYGPEKTPYLDTFHAVTCTIIEKLPIEKLQLEELQGVWELQAFAFCVVTVNDEHTKPRFKRKLRG